MKTKEELIKENKALQKQVNELKKSEIKDQKEDMLQVSEEKYRTLFENTGTATCILENDGTISMANPKFLQLSGYSSIDEIESRRTWMEFVVKEDLERMKKQHELRRKDNDKALTNYEFSFIDKKGNLKDIFLTVNIIPGTKKSVASLLDITERKKTEKKLHESEKNHRIISELASDYFYSLIIEPSGKLDIEWISKSFERVTTYSSDEIKNFDRWMSHIHTDDIPVLKKNLEVLLTNNFVTSEYRLFRKDGEIRWFYDRLKPEWDEKQQRVTRVFGAVNDITERKQAEDNFKISKLRYQKIFTESIVPIFLIVPGDSKIFEVNPAAVKLTKYERKELIDSNFSKIILDNKKETDELINTVKEKYFFRKKNMTIVTKKGENRIIDANFSYYTFEDKELIQLIGMDITERKQAELIKKTIYEIAESTHTAKTLEDLFQSIHKLVGTLMYAKNLFIALYDPSTDLLHFNYYVDKYYESMSPIKTTEGLTGYVFRTTKTLLLTPEIEEQLIAHKEINEIGKPSVSWLGVPLKVGNRVIGVLTVQSYEQGVRYEEKEKSILEYVSGQVAITISRKKVEEELIAAKEKAEESDRLKSAFLSNMSHEIRTPLNGILGFINLLKEPNLTGEEQNEYTDIIQKSGDRLLNTINDLIDISRIETGQVKISVSEVNVNKQVEELNRFFAPEAEKKSLKLYYKKSLPSEKVNINTDKTKFNTILTNLLKNAIKYTDKGFIEFGYKKNKNYLEFYVKDTGIGIPENRQGAIFNRFVQADIEDTKVFEGSGLGLAIAKSYVEILGGKISVESEEGKGSTFYFTIPYKVSENETDTFKEPIPGQKDEKKVKNLKILIAEDEEIAIIHLTIILRGISKKILFAKTGVEAVEICKKNKDIDLVLMDIRMPKMDGYEATRKIREFNKDISIIAQTAYALLGDREKSLEAGCDDYITKPIDKDELLEKIKRYFSE